MNPYILLGLLAAGVGAAWYFGQEKEASASGGPVWKWSATNITEQGPGPTWQVWIEEPGAADQYVMGGTLEFQTYDAAKQAAIAFIQSRGGTPVEFTA